MKTKPIVYSNLFFSMTFEYLNVYLSEQMGYSPKTIQSYCDALSLFRQFVSEILEVSIAKFTFSLCNRDCIYLFMAFLKERGNAPSTQNQRLAALKSYLWFAADKDISLQSLALEAKRIPSFKVKKKDLEVLSHEALTSIFAQPSNTKMGLRDRTIMIVLYDSAIRLDEVLKLKLLDVQIGDSPYLRVHGKGSKERLVPISLKTTRHLQQYIEFFHGKDSPETDLLFYTFIKGNADAMSESNVERFIKKYANKARESCEEIPKDVFPHLLRRTRATDLYQNGVEIELISRLLGHASVETTRKYYAKPSLKMLADAINSVSIPKCEQETPLWEEGEKLMAKICGLR